MAYFMLMNLNKMTIYSQSRRSPLPPFMLSRAIRQSAEKVPKRAVAIAAALLAAVLLAAVLLSPLSRLKKQEFRSTG
jgi:hypothetical protein